MAKPFSCAFGLWVTPDFSEVEAGRRAPPRVNHSEIDFLALAQFFKDLFPYGPQVTIRVPNDSIDQVTIHLRGTSSNPDAMRCSDFGTAMLAKAKESTDPVIDVRAAWSKLHKLQDRNFAPPPVLLPFVATAQDFEDAMLWHGQTRPPLGLPLLDPFGLDGESETEYMGKLPMKFQKRLEAIFGSPYTDMATLDRMATDKPPKYVSDIMG